MIRAVAALAALVILAGCAGQPAAQKAGELRVYRANDRLQVDRVPTMNEDEPGCHDMLLGLTIYRVAQIGFEYCTVYAERNCEEGTEVPVSWKQEDDPVTKFTQGDRWFLVGDDPRGHRMGSWYCEARK